MDGMTSKNGKPFDATLQYSAERRGLEFIYPESKGFNQQSLGGVQLSPNQIKMLSEGHTILVEDMKRTDGALFSSFVTLDKVTGRPQYTRHNPENGEIYIPKEICNVLLTPEDKEALRKGQPVFLENSKGEEFSSFVKLDMNTGRPQYSRTPDGFSERQVPVVPAEVYGHVFTAQERANLQDGKTILVSDLKSANNKTFSSYLKVNANSGQLQYFQENPDIRRNTARRAAQADDTQNRQQEQKKGSRQAVYMKQNDNRIFRKEDLDWKTLETIGIHKEELEKSGDMELLLQGEETETVPLKIRTPALRLTMDATLRITVGTDGKPVMEINGISPEAESEAGG